MKHRKSSLVVAATSLLALGSSISSTNAATLVGYDFVSDYSQTTGTATGSDVSYGSFDAGTLNTSHGRSGATDSLFIRESATGATAADGDTLVEAISLGNYAGFTLTNSTAGTIDLGSFSFDIFFEPYNFTGVEHSVFVMSDSSGFTDGNQLGGVTYAPGTAPDFGEGDSPDTITVDLSSLGNLAVSDTIEFRLYFVDDSDSNDHIFRVNNITVSAIPEPSSILLSGLALAGLALRRRR